MDSDNQGSILTSAHGTEQEAYDTLREVWYHEERGDPDWDADATDAEMLEYMTEGRGIALYIDEHTSTFRARLKRRHKHDP